MVKILPPYKPEVAPTKLGLRVSVAPSPHRLFIKDVGYYDAMGRSPMQMFQIWGIKDDAKRVSKLKEVMHEWPGTRHRRHMLYDAAERNDIPIVRFLVETGLKLHPDIPGRNGIPPKDENDKEEEDNCEDDDQDDTTINPSHVAAIKGNLECLKIILETGKLDVDVRDDVGRTPLGAAVQGGHIEIVKYLLENGANPTWRMDAENKISQEYFSYLAGADPIELAGTEPKLEIFQLLLEHPIYGSKRNRKPPPNAEAGVYVTPNLIRAVATGKNLEVLKYLLERGSYPLDGKDGKTKGELLDDKQRKGIEEATADIIEKANYESTMLMLSYLYPTNDNGEVLPFDVPEELHRHFIWGSYAAINVNDIKKFEWLYTFGLKEHDSMSLDDVPKDQLLNFQNLLEVASEAGALDSVKHLITKYGAQPEKQRLPPGLRAIYIAALNDKTEIVRYFLENYSIDIHFGNGAFSSGATALHAAIFMKSYESIELLLRAGGPVDSIDEGISDIEGPISAILIAEFSPRARIRLQTEQNAKEYIDRTRKDWERFNPTNVRLELFPEDKEWISNLVPRKPDAELQEQGEMARRLDENDSSRKDPCQYLSHVPISKARADLLGGDDDIVPDWEPLFVPVSSDN